MYGYKAFLKTDDGLKTMFGDKSIVYEVGKQYTIAGDLEMCANGYHYCSTPLQTYLFYRPSSVVHKIEIVGNVLVTSTKCCTSSYIIMEPCNGRYEEKSLAKDIDGASYWEAGRLHRIDGPAIEFMDGYEAWYRNGEMHHKLHPYLRRISISLPYQ